MTLARLRRLALGLGIALCAARPAPAQVAAADSAHLVAVTQDLMDAIASGDTAVWSRQLAPDWFLSDEEGNHVTRAELLHAAHPLPPGQSGKLTVTHPYLTGGGDVAVLAYDSEESHNYYGQILLTTFHSTDVWVRRKGRWWQIASQVTALPRAIEGLPVDSSDVHDAPGTYALTPEIRTAVARDDSGLVMTRGSGAPTRLFKLDRGVFVRRGARGFWMFQRDAAGAVTGLVYWRDNNGVVWKRQR